MYKTKRQLTKEIQDLKTELHFMRGERDELRRIVEHKNSAVISMASHSPHSDFWKGAYWVLEDILHRFAGAKFVYGVCDDDLF